MMNAPTDVRVRRPRQHEPLMLELQQEAGFATYRDILLFAAAVGFCQKRRVPFTDAAGDRIRYEVLTGPSYSDTLVNMIAVNVVDDAEILDDAKVEERVTIFEEYANGGLEYIQEQCNVRHQPAALVIIELVSQAFDSDGGAKPASIDELLRGVSW